MRAPWRARWRFARRHDPRGTPSLCPRHRLSRTTHAAVHRQTHLPRDARPASRHLWPAVGGVARPRAAAIFAALPATASDGGGEVLVSTGAPIAHRTQRWLFRAFGRQVIVQCGGSTLVMSGQFGRRTATVVGGAIALTVGIAMVTTNVKPIVAGVGRVLVSAGSHTH